MPADAGSLILAREHTSRREDCVDDVEWLIDNAAAYRALVGAMRDATSTIWISQLALDVDCVAYDVPDAGADGVRIVDELLAAAARGVEVRVLLNASLLLDTTRALRTHAAAASPGRVHVRGVSRFPQLLHAKMVLVDESVAFLVGSPFANGYWDDECHAPHDSRRPQRELGGRPVHDVSTRLTGSVVRALGSTFATLWNDAEDVAPGDTERLEVAVPDAGRGTHRVSVVQTGPGPHGPTQILSALLAEIARAREIIYIEHQYLSSRPIVRALTRALEHHRALELVIVLNQNPDVTAYRGWQNERLRDAGLLSHPRVGVFTLWTSAVEPAGVRRLLNQVFVHSKVVVIDDRWALAGSANLDGVSLHSYGDDFTGMLGRRIFRGVRNFDVNVTVRDGRSEDVSQLDDGTTEPGGRVRELRERLWREHLGTAFQSAGGRPAEGWLPQWRSVAQRNVAALNGADGGSSRRSPGYPGAATVLDGSFVLPYSNRSTPRAQLADVGVVLAPDAIELCFEPSWLEVHFSPNWVRNMFA